jgi:Ca2+-binding RTX toxin-like protein
MLNGGTGVDTATGGLGDDTFFVDQAADLCIEGVGEGTDTVRSTVTYTVGANIENLTLLGAANINGTGNNLANIVTGNTGDNVLNGGTGADSLRGDLGNDTYVIDDAGDTIIEPAAGGTDLVNSSVSFTLGANVENLTLTGAGAINGTGNTLANIITGNAGANLLNGGTGNDDLFGKGGNDDLTGGGGADKFRFDTALNAASNVDDILDFSVVDDTIFLDRDVFTAILVDGTLAAGAFRAGVAAVDADDRIIYNAATGQIFYDSDGVGGAAQILFATVVAGTALTNADFSAYV